MDAHLKANAEMTIEQLRPLSGMDFGYNGESVAWYGYWRVSQVVRFFHDPANHWGALDAFFILCLCFRGLRIRYSLSRIFPDHLAAVVALPSLS